MSTPSLPFLSGSLHSFSYWCVGGSGDPSLEGPLKSPSFKNEFKEGVKESHSKSSLPSNYTGLLSAPPAHYNGSHLGAFGLELSQPRLLFKQTVTRLAPSHSPVSLQMSLLKEAFALPPKQSYLFQVTLSLTFFIVHILIICFYVYCFLP